MSSRMVNRPTTSFFQQSLNHAGLIGPVELCAGMDARANGSGPGMKHETILTGEGWPSRDPRIDVDYDVRVHCDAGPVQAQILNLSADGFRLHSAKPIDVGAEVTLEVAKQFPV